VTALLITAFITGLFGSLHCAGMCGPIALSFNLQGRGNAVVNATLYNAARIIAYMLIGILFGTIGSSFRYAGWQQAAAVSMGVIIILIAILTWLGGSSSPKIPWLSS
jgi:sulfite exporter TauE/SafE